MEEEIYRPSRSDYEPEISEGTDTIWALFYIGDCVKYAAELLAKTIREK